MSAHTATALSHPNIAFIKYWGNRNEHLRLPANGSISMNLDGLFTRTSVSFQPSLALDELVINGHEMTGSGLARVSTILDEVRAAAGLHECAEVTSENNFPTGAGIASSAAALNSSETRMLIKIERGVIFICKDHLLTKDRKSVV